MTAARAKSPRDPGGAEDSFRDYCWLFAAALAARVLCAWWMGMFWDVPSDDRYDDGAYTHMAMGFVGLKESYSITHPPGYAFLPVPFMLLGRWGVPLAFAAQWLLGAAVPLLTYRLSRAMGQGRAAALAAGLIIAAHPLMIYFSTRLLSEMLFISLVLGFFLAWLGAWSRGSLRDAALAGLFGGLASLTRGVMLPFGGVLAAAAFLRRRERKNWALLIALCGGVWAAVVAPWTLRNFVRYERFIPISVQGGWNLYEGLTVDQEDIRRNRPAAMGEEAFARGLKDVFEIDAYFKRKAAAWISENPGAFLGLTLRKAVKFWRLFPYPPHPRPVRWAVGFFTGVVFSLALYGLFGGAPRSPLVFFFLSWAGYLTILHAVFASNLRYRLPVGPFIAILAGAGLALLLRGRK